MECKTILESTCPRMHRTSRRCFEKVSICRKCEAEDREKERKKRRDHDLDMEREARKKQYTKQLQEIQDKIDQERRTLSDRAEQDEQESVLRQRRQDLQNITRLARAPQEIPSIQESVPAGVEASSATNMHTVGHAPKQPEGTPQSVKKPLASRSSSREEWMHQKEFEGAQNEELDALMDMIGLDEVKAKFLAIKSKVDTAIRQQIDVKLDRFGATLLGNPGTGF